MRLRIFDWNTPWFWVTVFYHRDFGKRLELSVWSPNRWSRWWLNCWKWEKLPPANMGYEHIEKEEEASTEPPRSGMGPE